jgi:Na+/serine symporter
MIELLNIISAILAILATFYLFMMSRYTAGELKKAYFFSAFGVLIALAVHAFAEFLEVFGFLAIDTLKVIMPVFVLIGSILLIIGTYYQYKLLRDLKRNS